MIVARALRFPRRMTRFHRFAVALLLFLVATPSIANAADPFGDGLGGHVRTTDDRLRRLLERGTRISPTFRALVHRLLASDVIVYLWCDSADAPPSDGRLTFLSAAGGYRYVVVRLARLRSRERQIAIMAHELRHAIEIADAPDVIDGPSMAREYRRIGYVSSPPSGDRLTFDSHAAVDAGVQVLRELTFIDDEY
jgi:hypothetical protein